MTAVIEPVSDVVPSGRADGKSFGEPIRFGLAARIALATAVVGALTVAALTTYMYLGSIDILKQRDTERLSASVGISASRLASRIDFYRRDTVMLSKTPPATGIFRAQAHNGIDPVDGSAESIWRDRLATIFAGLIEARPEYFQVRYIGFANGGREIVRVDRLTDGRIARTPEGDLQDKSNRNYYKDSIALDRGQIYLSDIDLNRERGQIEVPHRPALRTATPVFSESGERLGVIVINVDMARIFGILEDSVPDTVEYFVANQQGDYLVHPDRSRAFGFDLGERHLMQDEFPVLAPLFGKGGDRFSGAIESPDGQRLAFAERVHLDPADPDRFVVIGQSVQQDMLSQDIRSLRNRTVAVAGVFVLAGLLAILWQVGVLVRPLSVISRKAAAVARGNLDVDMSDIGRHGDEVGALARSFDEMARQVKAREMDLAARAEELQHANQQLVRSNQELSQFAYVASHDLQEPLRMVDSYMGLIERRYKGKLDEDADEFIGFAVDGARRMKRLINDLLDYSRVSNRPLELKPVDTRATAEAVVRLLQPKIAETAATVEMGALPIVEADAGQIERLFTNLIGNAIKFHGDAPPVVRIDAKRKGRFFEFTVADNGIGIAPEFRQKVFEIFTRLHGRDKYDGTGIGLAACRRIVELHGGKIWIETGDEGGTVFHLTLPANRQKGQA